MKVAIVGSRNFEDYELLKTTMKAYLAEASIIITGGAKGADRLGAKWSREFLKQKPLVIKPDWKDISQRDAAIKYNRKGERYDAKAGIRRNERIVDMADAVVAFWDGQSSGTRHVIHYAKQQRKVLQVIRFRESFQLELPF